MVMQLGQVGAALHHDYACTAKFSNTTSVGKNLNFNQVHGCFTLPPSSFFLNYALLVKVEIIFLAYVVLEKLQYIYNTQLVG